jgi:hypothetical protein
MTRKLDPHSAKPATHSHAHAAKSAAALSEPPAGSARFRLSFPEAVEILQHALYAAAAAAVPVLAELGHRAMDTMIASGVCAVSSTALKFLNHFLRDTRRAD